MDGERLEDELGGSSHDMQIWKQHGRTIDRRTRPGSLARADLAIVIIAAAVARCARYRVPPELAGMWSSCSKVHG
eukprot:6732192-Pyramimonas_sp.AAC.1